MKRFITSLALLAVIALIGCEKHESPVAPPSQEQQVKSTTGFDVKASTAQLKEKVEAWKAQIEEHVAALKMQVAKQKQSQVPKIASSSKITVPSSSYPTIQSAVFAASPGTKIIVKDGTYTEFVIVKTDYLTITAAHAGQAHIIGGFGFGGVTGGKLEGFVITGDAPGGVNLFECSEVEIKENEVAAYFGILLESSVDCVVKDNNVHDVPGGVGIPSSITIYFGGKHLVKGNYVHDNGSPDGVGILIAEGLNNTSPGPGKNEISSNKCTGNDYGILVYSSRENNLGDNECNDNNLVGIYLLVDSDHNKIGSDNEANNNGGYGIILESDCDDNTVTKNEAHGNVVCDALDLATGNTFIENEFGTFNCP